MTILLTANVPFMKKSMKKLLQLENLYHHLLTSESPIYVGIQQMSEKDCETLSKLHDIFFHIALQRLPFTTFENQVALEKLHGVKFTGAYENENACKNFIFRISECLFEEKVKKKLTLSLSYVMDQLAIASLSKRYYM